jgi:hypothetical protein
MSSAVLPALVGEAVTAAGRSAIDPEKYSTLFVAITLDVLNPNSMKAQR